MKELDNSFDWSGSSDVKKDLKMVAIKELISGNAFIAYDGTGPGSDVTDYALLGIIAFATEAIAHNSNKSHKQEALQHA